MSEDRHPDQPEGQDERSERVRRIKEAICRGEYDVDDILGQMAVALEHQLDEEGRGRSEDNAGEMG